MFDANKLFIDNDDTTSLYSYYTYSFNKIQEIKNEYTFSWSCFEKDWTDEQIISYIDNGEHCEHKNMYYSCETFCVKIKTTYDYQKFLKQISKYVRIMTILGIDNNYENFEQNLMSIGEIIYYKKRVNLNAQNVIKRNA